MKIVVLEGSPNKNGSSNLLANEFIRGAQEAGHSCTAIDAAMADAQKGGLAPVPPYLRDQSYATPHARTPQYKYPHDYPGHFVKQAYMPPGYEHTVYYRPTGQGHEAKLRDRHARRFGEGHEA